MIRLAHPDIGKIFELRENCVNTLVIENQDFFRAIITDIIRQLDGYDGKLVLSDDMIPISFSGNVDCISQFVPFEINRKTILTKLCSRI